MCICKHIHTYVNKYTGRHTHNHAHTHTHLHAGELVTQPCDECGVATVSRIDKIICLFCRTLSL